MEDRGDFVLGIGFREGVFGLLFVLRWYTRGYIWPMNEGYSDDATGDVVDAVLVDVLREAQSEPQSGLVRGGHSK